MQIEEIGGSEASGYRAPWVVVSKQLVVNLTTACQRDSSFLSVVVRDKKVAAICKDRKDGAEY